MCARSGAERSPGQLWGPVLRPCLGPRSSASNAYTVLRVRPKRGEAASEVPDNTRFRGAKPPRG
eukprot:8272467-Alexandrium_andersonii.AAC.1